MCILRMSAVLCIARPARRVCWVYMYMWDWQAAIDGLSTCDQFYGFNVV